VTGLSWPAIVRLGLVQAAIGAVVTFAVSTLNRLMVVEYSLPAMIPAALVAWHYAVQLSRARWGYGSDMGRARTPWIVGGMAVLAGCGVLAAVATTWLATDRTLGLLIGAVAYAGLGAGVGAAGTSLLALLAAAVAPARRPGAAALTWILMIVGFIVSAGITGKLLAPFSPERLIAVSMGISSVALVVTLVATWGVERALPPATERAEQRPPFAAVLADIWHDAAARRFTLFVFVSMLAFSAQELILEPFAGLVFGYTPAQSASLNATQHSGVLLGMILVGVAGNAFGGKAKGWMRSWTIAGCAGSALAMVALAAAAFAGPGWPLGPTVFMIGIANGVFAVASIGSMMGLAGGGAGGREGSRMGVWGAAQAVAFALGGFLGAAGVDAGRHVFAQSSSAFIAVFAVEGAVFIIAAAVAASGDAPRRRPTYSPLYQEVRP